MLSISHDSHLIVQNIAGCTAERLDVMVEKHEQLELRPDGFPIPHLKIGDHFQVRAYLLRRTTGKNTEAHSFPPHMLDYCRTLKKEFNLLHTTEGIPSLLKQTITAYCFNKQNIRFDRDFELTYNLMTEDLKLYPLGTVRVTRPLEAQPVAL